jgi:hypothetical protein
MVKQQNIFTGKVDILQDPADSIEQVYRAHHALGSQAGKIVKIRTRPAPPKIELPTDQIRLF